MLMLCSDSPPRKTCTGSPVSTTADVRPSTTVSTELFPEFTYARRDCDGQPVDRRPPLPPPRRPAVAPRSSPPPPPATTATASIEDVIGRLRLDEARKMAASNPATDCGVRRVPRMGTRLCGDVAPLWSAPLSEPAPPEIARLSDLTLDKDRLSPPPRDGMAAAMFSVEVGSSGGVVDRRLGVSRSTQTDSDAPVEAYRVCADVMYTNRANLRHTIAVQQRLFRQQLADRQSTIQRPTPDDGPRPTAPDDRPQPGATMTPAKMEWIVRKRSDGSRYVTRRPVRTVRRSAAGDVTTTDDDEAEQPKTGRYWTRDQRRQHVAERRRRDAVKQIKREAACRSPTGRAQHGLAEELAAIGRHRQTPLLSVATV